MISFRHLCCFSTHLVSELVCELKVFGKAIINALSEHIVCMFSENLELEGTKLKEYSLKVIQEIIHPIIEKTEKDIEHPQCIWNESTRHEFKNCIKRQLEYYHKNFKEKTYQIIEEFTSLKYSSYENEDRVDGVFIRILNSHPYMKITNPSRIACGFFLEIEKVDQNDLSTSHDLLIRAISLFESLSNIIVYQKQLDISILNEHNIKVLCNFLDSRFDLLPKWKETVHNFIWNIIMEMSKTAKQVFQLSSSTSFKRTILLKLNQLNNDSQTSTILSCLENFVSQPDCDEILFISGFLINFLRHSFNEKMERKFRWTFLRFSQTLLSRMVKKMNKIMLTNILPKFFIDLLIEEPPRKQEDLTNIFDLEHFNTVELIWCKELKEKVIQALDLEWNNIENQLMKEEKIVLWKEPAESYISNIENKGEIVISGVILGVFMQNPFIKLKVFHLTMINYFLVQIFRVR